MEYDPEEEAYKARCKKWGMHSKKSEDVTIEDCISDVRATVKNLPDAIKGIVVVVVWDFLESGIIQEEMAGKELVDIPPMNTFLCSGGMSVPEVLGSMEKVKHKMLTME